MDLETLLAEREIARALVRLARAMDERDWDTARALFRDDATAELGTGPISGSEAIVETIRGYLDACGPTQHLLGNILIDVDPEAGTASSRAYVNDMHLGRGSRRDLTFATLGDYLDRWEHDGTAWRIRHRTKVSRATVGSMDVFLGG